MTTSTSGPRALFQKPGLAVGDVDRDGAAEIVLSGEGAMQIFSH